MRVTVWGEEFLDVEALPEDARPLNYAGYVDEARRIYPDDVHRAIAASLGRLLPADAVRTSVLADADHGLSAELLDRTDVLVWWAHVKQRAIPDEVVERVWRRIVRDGMGLVMLHAGIESTIFRRLMGTSCGIAALRQSDDWEALWTVEPTHPIARGVPPVVVLDSEEMYCEPFDVPTPDEVVFLSTFRGGEVFRSGCCWRRGNGRVFYFRPGHESHPTYHQPDVQRILANAVSWAAPAVQRDDLWTLDADEAATRTHLVEEGWFR